MEVATVRDKIQSAAGPPSTKQLPTSSRRDCRNSPKDLSHLG